MGAVLSVPAAREHSCMKVGERHRLRVPIKIKLLPLLEEKKKWGGDCGLYTCYLIISCILETQSNTDTLHSHSPQVLKLLAGSANCEVHNLVFRGKNVIILNVCKCNVIVWYYGTLLVTAIITHGFYLAPTQVVGKFPNDFNWSKYASQSHFFPEGNENIRFCTCMWLLMVKNDHCKHLKISEY